MALSPWSALLGDRVWNPHAFLFVEGLALLGVLRLRENPGSRWAIVVPVACLALPQLHMSAPVVWLALLPLAAGSIRRWNRRYLMLGLALGLLLYIPYAIHEARTGLDNTRAFLTETFAPKKKTGPANLTFLLTPLYALRFLTLDVSYHELTGYWGGLNEAAAWRALWQGSAARPFHPLRLLTLLASLALLVIALASGLRAAVQRGREQGWRAALGPFAWAGLVAVTLNLVFLGLARKQIFAHYVTLTLPFVFVLYAPLGERALAALRTASGTRRAFGAAVLGLAVLFGLGGIESTLTVSRRIDGRIGLGTFRLVSGRVLEDLAREGRTPAQQPVSLSFGFFNNTYAYGILSRLALPAPIRWDGNGARFAYRLQKPEDPPPAGAEAFPVTKGASATLYRLR
jgi:hypothetical protein